jgi:2-methylcitrate dehydratase
MKHAEQLAAFIYNAKYEDLFESAWLQLKIRVLDALGCAIGALGSEVSRSIRAQIEDFGGVGLCALIGGGLSAPDRAAFYNTALLLSPG